MPDENWNILYEAALLETDSRAMAVRIELAEKALFARRDTLSDASGHSAERRRIDDALSSLRVLKNERMG
jgi:hypothetical protein